MRVSPGPELVRPHREYCFQDALSILREFKFILEKLGSLEKKVTSMAKYCLVMRK